MFIFSRFLGSKSKFLQIQFQFELDSQAPESQERVGLPLEVLRVVPRRGCDVAREDRLHQRMEEMEHECGRSKATHHIFYISRNILSVVIVLYRSFRVIRVPSGG